MEVNTLFEQLFFVTVYLIVETAEEMRSGTGFIYSIDTNKGQAFIVVTNKHVLEGARTLTLQSVSATADGRPNLGTISQFVASPFNAESWVGHPDPKIDVAVFPFSPILHAFPEKKGAPFFRAVTREISLTKEGEDSLDALEPVTFVGYPAGLFDEKNGLPIARRGSTATPIAVDYQGLPAFLIDASVFPGSSGSPVFLADQGTFTEKGKGTVVGTRLMCLGVLAAVHARLVDGAIVNRPTALVAEFNEPIDLGIVFKAPAIEECVDLFLRAVDLTRTPRSVPMNPDPAAIANDPLGDLPLEGPPSR